MSTKSINIKGPVNADNTRQSGDFLKTGFQYLDEVNNSMWKK